MMALEWATSCLNHFLRLLVFGCMVGTQVQQWIVTGLGLRPGGQLSPGQRLRHHSSQAGFICQQNPRFRTENPNCQAGLAAREWIPDGTLHVPAPMRLVSDQSPTCLSVATGA